MPRSRPEHWPSTSPWASAGSPRGRVVEIFGPESSGKTTLALHIIAEAQKAGGLAAFVDAEHAIDPTYARAIGVDLENLYFSQPDNGEQALEITDTLVRSAPSTWSSSTPSPPLYLGPRSKVRWATLMWDFRPA